jgi:hypothetical protein
MNPRQRIVLMIGSVAVLTVTLFPPWVYQLNQHDFGNPRISGDHAFALSPPSRGDAAAALLESPLGSLQRDARNGYALYVSVWLDGPRLAGELAGVVLATAGLVLAFWSRTEESRTKPS